MANTRARVPMAIAPMLARSTTGFPHGRPGDYAYEPKMDGFRCLATTDSDRGVHLQSRRGARLNETFPEVAWAAFEHIPAGTILDGEIVRWSGSQLDFAALQRRQAAGHRGAAVLARSESCHYVVFDVLRLRGRNVMDRPLSERRALLEELFVPLPAAGALALSMHTRNEAEARVWYETMHVAGVEGLVIKPARSRYEMGVRGWQKYKYRASAECVVGGYVGSPRRPSGLILGRYDRTGRLRVVGRTTRLTTQAAAELAPLFVPASGAHPWPVPLPPGWTGSPYGQHDPITYTPVQPEVVVEVLVDTAVENGRHRHPVKLLRVRTDLEPAHVIEQGSAVA